MNLIPGPWEVMVLFFGILYLIPFWHICKKAGYSGALALLMLIPLVNLGLFYFLAFAKWPSLAELDRG